ncbi:hypothetical protein CF336_g4803 [Tilletia laevis]|uniref:DNA mismatch repair protein S5 domain-containing protein n=1 Tax=Tilletia caries TaxID=13290 RepID=A0ABN7IY70_9BASI|nr:hypothetical protein CF336_g4803 [Tilletia laevis]CAD6931065.1 unnamed protein product [Tilletia caries]
MNRSIAASTSSALVSAHAGHTVPTPAPNAHADKHKFGKLTAADGMAVFSTAVTIFNELSDLTGVAGPFLKMGLGVVQEIISIVEQVKSNKDACAKFVETALQILHGFAIADQASGCPTLPGTATASLIEPVLQQIKTAKKQIAVYAQLPRWQRLLKRDEIKDFVNGCTEVLDRKLLSFTAQMVVVQGKRVDYVLAQSFVGANPVTASSPVITVFEEPEVIQESLPDQSLDILDDSIQQALQQVSTAVTSGIKKRATLEDAQIAGVNVDAQGTGSNQLNTSSQQPFTSEEQQQMYELREAMQRLFLPGDSENVEGIFHKDGADADPIAKSDDPAQSALDLLDKLCDEPDPSYSKQTLQLLAALSVNLEKLGLFDEAVLVMQLFTALYRRKVTSKEYALDRANFASALRSLGLAFLSIGRCDEALTTSEEVISIIKPMADREPKRHNGHLARAMVLVCNCQWQVGEHDVAMLSAVRALDLIRSLHKEQPEEFKEDLAKTLGTYSTMLNEAGQYEEALTTPANRTHLSKARVLPPWWTALGHLSHPHRLVDYPSLKRAMEAMYSGLLPKGGHPWLYISLEIEPNRIDVSVHPTKREVHFLDEGEIMESVCTRAEARLTGANTSRTFKLTQPLLPGASEPSSKRQQTEDDQNPARDQCPKAPGQHRLRRAAFEASHGSSPRRLCPASTGW